MRQVFFIITLLFTFISASQDFEHVDNKVKSYPKQFSSIKNLAQRVASDFNTDTDKVRAVYFWISNHIKYDYTSYNKGTNGYQSIKVTNGKDYDIQLQKMKRTYAERALKRQLAVCEGYSQLMKFTLQELGIEAEVITGYARTLASQIGRIQHGTNHAWNSVKLDKQWKLIDATWSTGNDTGAQGDFNFTDTYFLIAPEALIKSHFPKEKKWQLLKNPISKADFFYQPLFYETYYNSGLELNKKQLGLIKVKPTDFIEITFDAIDTDNANYYYSLSKNGETKRLFFQEKDGKYITKIPCNAKRKTVLGIYNHFSAAIEFQIIVQN